MQLRVISTFKTKVQRKRASRKLKRSKSSFFGRSNKKSRGSVSPFRGKGRNSKNAGSSWLDSIFKKPDFLDNKPIIKYLFAFISILLVLLSMTSIVFVGRQYISYENHNKTNWDGKTKINVLFIGLDTKANNYAFADLIAVAAINPENKSTGIFTVDPDISFKLYGEETTTLRKSYNLNVNNNQGVPNVINGVESVLALKIDKYVVLDKSDFNNLSLLIGPLKVKIPADAVEKGYKIDNQPIKLEKGYKTYSDGAAIGVMAVDEYGVDNKLLVQAEFLQNYLIKTGSIRNIIFTLINLGKLNGLNTNFSKLELARFYYFTTKLGTSDVRIGYTRQASLLMVDPRNKEAGKDILAENIDKDIQSIFLDQNIIKEQARLEVLNGTSIPGLANKYSRLFTNHGIRMVRTDNSIQPSSNTILFVDDQKKYPNTIMEIKSTFRGKVKIIEQDYKYKHIGDMVLVIGEESL